MTKIWRNRLIAGTQVFSNCPEKYKEDVIKLLKEDVAKGVITEDRYKEIIGS